MLFRSIGLLAADRLNDDQRRAVGWTLLAVGALSTIPLAAEVAFRGNRPEPSRAFEDQEAEGGAWQARQSTAPLSP